MTPAPLKDRAALLAQVLILEDFPRPDIARTLSPNGRAHWTAKRKARLSVIDYVVVHAIKSGLRRMPAPVQLYLTYIMPDRRTRDQDNYSTGVTKAVIDILVKGQWLDGDSTDLLRLAPVEVRVEKGRRALELRFEVGAA